MRLFFILPVAFLLLLSGCGSGVPSIAPLDKNAKIVVFGDDFVASIEQPPEQRFTYLLGQKLGLPVIEAGKAEERSYEGIERLGQVLDQEKPNLVIICHGWTDLLEGVAEEDTIDAVRGMVGLSKHRNIDVILMAIPMPSLDSPIIRPVWFYRKIAGVFKVPNQGATLSYALMEKEYHDEHWNLTSQGHQAVAADLVELIHQAQAK